MQVFYSPLYVAAAHSFDTTRKSKWIAESLRKKPIDGLRLVDPEPLTEAQVQVVHSKEYVAAVKSGKPKALAESQDFKWDRRLWNMVASSNGGVVAATRAALRKGVSGSLSSGLHHARWNSGRSYCTFNGLALAALAAIEEGAESVLILDLDAHHGGGTASLIAGNDRIWQVDVGTNFYDDYDQTTRIYSCTSQEDEYLDIVRDALSYFDWHRFDLCIYNAGMDPVSDEISVEDLRAREAMVFQWCAEQDLPVAFVLAGGYTGSKLSPNGLVELHRFTLEEAQKVAGKLSRPKGEV